GNRLREYTLERGLSEDVGGRLEDDLLHWRWLQPCALRRLHRRIPQSRRAGTESRLRNFALRLATTCNPQPHGADGGASASLFCAGLAVLQKALLLLDLLDPPEYRPVRDPQPGPARHLPRDRPAALPLQVEPIRQLPLSLPPSFPATRLLVLDDLP